MTYKILLAATIVVVASLGCDRDPAVNIEPGSSGPFVRVRAFEAVHGAKLAQLQPGGNVRLGLFGYTATDSINADATWIVRDARIASNLGSTVSALAAGTTYVVGSVVNHGVLFSDSVSVFVSP